jgi:hypothetical protein
MTVVPDRPFSSSQIAELGLSHRQLQALVATRLVRRVARGAYVPTHLADTIETRAAAIAAVVSPHHIVVDRTAATIHGVEVVTWAEHDVVPPVETCVLPRRNPSRRREVDGRTRDLRPDEIIAIAGIRMTTPLRTALDLGCRLRRREAYAAMTMLARTHGFVAADLIEGLDRFAGRRGVRQLRDLVGLVDPRLESPREAWTLLAILDAGLPAPQPQHWIEVDGVPTYRLDFAWPHLRVCVEYDGAEFHDRTPEQRGDDRDRRRWLREHGWTVIVIRSGAFTGGALDGWLRELRTALQPSYTNKRW